MRHVNIPKQFVVVVAVAVALAIAVATSGQSTSQAFPVDVINTSSTPRLGEDVPFGHVQIQCGSGWNSMPFSHNKQRVDCYPSWDSDPFDVTFKVRLANDADGNAVYHSLTTTFNSPGLPTIRGPETQPTPKFNCRVPEPPSPPGARSAIIRHNPRPADRR